MKHFSMFSGVEGIGMGLPPEWELVGLSEWDKYASQVLKYHYPNVKNHGDCTKINWSEIPDFDLLTGGSPCQDFSIAGKRRGLKGTKSALAWEYIRCLRAKQPRYFIWENVRGVMSSRGGWDFANLLCAFSESGYSLWWQVLNAKDFGVPQNRERIFVIGFREGSPKEVFFEPKDSGQIEVLGTTKGEENTRIGERDMVYGGGGLMGGLKATDYKQPPQILNFVGAVLSEKKWLNDGKENSRNFPQGNRVYGTDGLSSTLSSQGGGQGAKTGLYAVLTPNRINKRQNGRRMKTDGEPSFTLNTQDRQGVYDGVKVRKLMPIECERLMGWKDNWTKFGRTEKGEVVEISDSQRYKMCGNGVVSNVVREIVKNLLNE